MDMTLTGRVPGFVCVCVCSCSILNTKIQSEDLFGFPKEPIEGE